MSNKEERFVLYEYLLYFWKKKWAFLIIPIITIVLAIAVNALWPKDGDYEGQATIYVGSVKTPALTDPIHYTSKYNDKINNKLKIHVPSSGYLRIRIFGDDRKTIESELNLITSQMEEEIRNQSDLQVNLTKANRQRLEEEIEKLEKDIKTYEPKINNENPNELEIEFATKRLDAEAALINSTRSVNSMGNDIDMFEYPEILDSTVDDTKTYTLESALIGLLLGLILTVALLTLLKYIERAKRYYNSK